MTVQEMISTPSCGCDHADVSKGLWPVSDALKQILSLIEPIKETEFIGLANASGRILATDICATEDAPRFDTAAVDGYAVSMDQFQGSGPWNLTVDGRIAAGDPVGDGRPKAVAVQIFTGAKVPEGLDAVIMQEVVNRSGSRVIISNRPKPGLNIRKAGEEYTVGRTLLSSGAVLGPIEIACTAAVGVGRLEVRRRLRISVVVSGNELRSAGDVLEGSDIWDVNTPMMQSVFDDPNLDVTDNVRVSDDRKCLAKALRCLAQSTDIVVVSGGASVGEEDHLHSAIKDAGGAVSVSGVAIKPGKPVTFGTIGKTLLVGLPGNPVSAFVTWMVLGRPVLDHLAGKTNQSVPAHHVRTGHPLRHNLGRCEYRPARITGYDGSGIEVIEADQATHSGRITSLLGADGLVRIPSFVEQVEPGDLLEFIPF